MMSTLISKVVHWLINTPTAYHLWCAEQELRRSFAPSASTQAERLRNLDRLRTYRKQAEFPRNDFARDRSVPCFVDGDDRHCAVAFLMKESGAKDAVAQIAAKANCARIREMHFPELDEWVKGCGLSKAELARIQPAYSPTLEEASKYCEIILTLWILCSLAVVESIFNTVRLLRKLTPRITTIFTGLVLGIILLVYAIGVDVSKFQRGWAKYHIEDTQKLALVVGAVSVLCATAGVWLKGAAIRPVRDLSILAGSAVGAFALLAIFRTEIESFVRDYRLYREVERGLFLSVILECLSIATFCATIGSLAWNGIHNLKRSSSVSQVDRIAEETETSYLKVP